MQTDPHPLKWLWLLRGEGFQGQGGGQREAFYKQNGTGVSVWVVSGRLTAVPPGGHRPACLGPPSSWSRVPPAAPTLSHRDSLMTPAPGPFCAWGRLSGALGQAPRWTLPSVGDRQVPWSPRPSLPRPGALLLNSFSPVGRQAALQGVSGQLVPGPGVHHEHVRH